MKKLLVTIFIILVSAPLIAQNLKRANSLFERKSYIEAAELYEKEDPKTQEIYEKLGDCYYYNSEMNSANLYYKMLISNYEENINPVYFYRYSQSLKGTNQFTEADKWLQKYYNLKQGEQTTNVKAAELIEALNSEQDFPFELFKISANTTGSDFGVTFNGDKIVFSSTRNKGSLYDWNNQPYLDLFEADKSDLGDLINVSSFSDDINTKMHESNAVFTKDGNTMYFTRNNFIDGKKGKDKNKVSHLKIYKAQFLNEKWTNITELPFNSNTYSTEHPALSPDEKKLYFASDMPGTLGSFDIFVVSLNSDGTYGEPKNLGPNINTEFREQFPFVSSTNTLYFASNGHFGLGNLDIFKSEILNKSYSTPVNMGNIINSSLDDFSFIINETKGSGYFSSNRPGGVGDDDIYGFSKIIINYTVVGVVQDKTTLDLIPGAQVALYDENNKLIEELIVDNDASYSFELEENKTYKIISKYNSYAPAEEIFITNDDNNPESNVLIQLERFEDKEEKIVVENNKRQIKIAPIFFDFNKWDIRSDAAIELDEVAAIMKKYPTMIIETGSHTDVRGSAEYNLLLSEKRAKSVMDYLISQGVSETNISSKGYGETQPLNKCIRGGICNEDEYAINRRCEFVILN